MLSLLYYNIREEPMTIALTVGGGYVILLISKYGKDTSHGGLTSLVSLHVAIYTTCIYHLITVVGSLIKCYSIYTEYR